jgi:hypothetical protein
MSGATDRDAGLASGLINTTTQVGAALGLAVLATLSATRTAGLAGHGAATAVALTGGYRLALVVAAALVGVALAVAVTVVRRDRPAAPEPGPQPATERERELAYACAADS